MKNTLKVIQSTELSVAAMSVAKCRIDPENNIHTRTVYE